MPDSPGRVARAAVSGLLVVAGLGAGLALGELACRVLVPRQHFSHIPMRLDDRQVWDDRPGGQGEDGGAPYSFDADGFRAESPPGLHERSVLFVGDSFTFGFGVADGQSFVAAAERGLARRGLRVRCLNAGASGFGTSHELRLMRRLLAQSSADAVVLQVFPGNDLEDNEEDGGFGLRQGRLVVQDPPRIPWRTRAKDWLAQNEDAVPAALWTVAVQAAYRSRIFAPRIGEAQYELENALLREAAAEARQRHIPLLVVVAAGDNEVARRKTSRARGGRRRARFVDMVSGLGTRWLDLKEIAGRPEDYLPENGHLSVGGNARVGDAIASELAPFLRRGRDQYLIRSATP